MEQKELHTTCMEILSGDSPLSVIPVLNKSNYRDMLQLVKLDDPSSYSLNILFKAVTISASSVGSSSDVGSESRSLLDRVLDLVHEEDMMNLFLSTSGNDKSTPLHVACKLNNVDVVRSILDHFPREEQKYQLLEARDFYGLTPLLKAGFYGGEALLDCLLYCVPDSVRLLKLVCHHRRSPLHAATFRTQKSSGALKVLLEYLFPNDNVEKQGIPSTACSNRNSFSCEQKILLTVLSLYSRCKGCGFSHG